MTKEDVLRRLRELELLLRPPNYKELYAERDTLTLALVAEGFSSATQDEISFRLVDNFQTKNVSWTASACRRYEIKIEDL